VSSPAPLYDSHCHLDRCAEPDDAVARARDAGVTAILVPAIDPAGWTSLGSLRARWPEVRIAIGIHPRALPELAPEVKRAALDALADQAREHRATAIGECGFDRGTAERHRISLDQQASIVAAHVETARALALPLVLHVVDAHGPALEAIARHARLPRGGVVHAWSGSRELAERWVALGFALGIGPSILRDRARRIAEIARALPLSHLVMETDAPDGRAPGRARGEPADVASVAARLAAIRGETEDAVRRATHERAVALFG
jgi:TatD DNase family protein